MTADRTTTLARHALVRGISIGGAESVTAGAVAVRLASGEEASRWFRGAVVAYSAEVKHEVLGVPPGPVVSRESVLAMADGARGLLRCDLAYAVTGVGGPEPAEGQEPGTVWIAVSGLGASQAQKHSFPGGVEEVLRGAVEGTLALLVTRLTAGRDRP